MPTYQYACTVCGHQLEVVQSFSDAPLTTCPECEGRLRKLFSSVGIVFKGSGFYRTDSRSGASSTDGASKADSTPASSSGTDSAKSSTSSSDSSSSSSSTSSSPSTSSPKSTAPATS